MAVPMVPGGGEKPGKQKANSGVTKAPHLTSFAKTYHGFCCRKVPSSNLDAGLEPSWANAYYTSLPFSSEELARIINKRYINGKYDRTVWEDYQALKSRFQRLRIDRLVEEQQRDEPNPNVEYVLASIHPEVRKIARPGRYEKETTEIQVILRRQPKPSIEGGSPLGVRDAHNLPGRVIGAEPVLETEPSVTTQKNSKGGKGKNTMTAPDPNIGETPLPSPPPPPPAEMAPHPPHPPPPPPPSSGPIGPSSVLHGRTPPPRMPVRMDPHVPCSQAPPPVLGDPGPPPRPVPLLSGGVDRPRSPRSDPHPQIQHGFQTEAMHSIPPTQAPSQPHTHGQLGVQAQVPIDHADGLQVPGQHAINLPPSGLPREQPIPQHNSGPQYPGSAQRLGQQTPCQPNHTVQRIPSEFQQAHPGAEKAYPGTQKSPTEGDRRRPVQGFVPNGMSNGLNHGFHSSYGRGVHMNSYQADDSYDSEELGDLEGLEEPEMLPFRKTSKRTFGRPADLPPLPQQRQVRPQTSHQNINISIGNNNGRKSEKSRRDRKGRSPHSSSSDEGSQRSYRSRNSVESTSGSSHRDHSPYDPRT
ncbi:uncharacterized protein K452DRAFT_311215 [Aplosporella prunicola CBS 121167]|uniref:Uncharacterized protein n=1 Tax=Aplosporella prunicola CBS 121167 TaxID=1176127 RepID=A0A6A6B3F8_9PEZI|nr:uncharacterized protein K452DRAFT_311215 [Aplosporella prunicola CBS 121167]KAF2138739.1 hypothetical protein K452DRAFT_311215 [Aplosporella prunicola CBS 121167]